MQFYNEILEAALTQVLWKKRQELFNNVKFDIDLEEIEKIVSEKSCSLLGIIVNYLGEDTEDYEAIEKIMKLLEENDIYCGERHS